MAAYTIEDMQKIAAGYGGKCLSNEYVSSHQPLKWMCKNGHTWDRVFSVMKQQGIWCSQCMVNESKLELLKEIAEKKGGECLSENYLGIYTKLKWRCKEGHVFLIAPKALKAGTWCKKCQTKLAREQALERLKKLAEKKGGQYLSGQYLNKFSKLKWQCDKGHIWVFQASRISAGKWCKQCNWDKYAAKELQRLNAFAQKKGGKCLSPVYQNTHLKLKWECKEGHKWSMTSKQLKKGSWCHKCWSKESDARTKKKILDKLSRYAGKNGGKVISEITPDYKIKIQCAEGHIWSADPRTVLLRKTWCKKCHTISRITPIEKLQKIAISKGGKLLSSEYANNTSYIKLQCDKGHIWETAVIQILAGRWCKVCQYSPKQFYLEKYKRIAQEHKGKLHSKEYQGVYKPLTFECVKGHIWETVAKNVSDGRWCPVCAGNQPKRTKAEIRN